MHFIYIIAIVILALIFIITLVGFTLPRITKMQRSVLIQASASSIFEYADSLKMFVEFWSPWTKKDTKANHKFNTIDNGVGAFYSWDGNRKTVGSGTMEIIDRQENKFVSYRLSFNEKGSADVLLSIENVNTAACKVTWSFESDTGNVPVARIFGVFMDRFLGPDFEKGLANLKEVVETKTAL